MARYVLCSREGFIKNLWLWLFLDQVAMFVVHELFMILVTTAQHLGQFTANALIYGKHEQSCN